MTRRAYCLIRTEPHYRHDAFCRGLQSAGFRVEAGAWPREFQPGETLLIWNRYHEYSDLATRCEKAGGTVLVAENGYTGVSWLGERWYSISKWHHNGAGEWNPGGPERWDSLGVELSPIRDGSEYIVLPQRGIGPEGVAMPSKWDRIAVDFLSKRTKRNVRVRPHPGNNVEDTLAQDLANAKGVVVWGSGAGIKAMLLGIPVFYAMPKWIGAPGATPLDEFPKARPDNRLECLQRLIWAQWTVREIESGLPFRRLLC